MLRSFSVLLFLASLCIGCGVSNPPQEVISEKPATPKNAGVEQTESVSTVPEPLIAPVAPDLQPVPASNAPAPVAESTAAEKAFRRLVEAAQNDQADQWLQAEAELRALGSAIVPVLTPILDNEEGLAREMAVMFLAQIGPEAAPAASALERLLNDPSPLLQVNAAALLTTFDQPSPGAIKTLTQLVDSPDTTLQLTAIGALGNVDNPPESAVKALTRALSTSNAQVRQAAANSLGRMGGSAVAAIPQLRELLADPEPPVKEAALFALQVLAPDTAEGPSVAVPASATAP